MIIGAFSLMGADCPVLQQQKEKTYNTSTQWCDGVLQNLGLVLQSFGVILLCPTTATGSRGYPMTELALQMNVSCLSLSPFSSGGI